MGMYSSIIKENDIMRIDSDILDILEEGQEINTFIEENYLKLCQEQGLEELSYFEINNKEIPFNEADSSLKDKFKSFIDKIIKKFKQFIEYIKSIFRKKVQVNKEFIKKYKDIILNTDLSEFSYIDYNYTNIFYKQDNIISKLWISIDKDTYNLSDEEIYEIMRGGAFNSNKLSKQEFEKKLFEYYRDGGEKKEVKVYPEDIVDILSTDEGDSLLKDLTNDVVLAIDRIKENSKNEMGYYKTKGEQELNLHIKSTKIAIQISQEILNSITKAVIDFHAQLKNQAIEIVKYAKEHPEKVKK